MTTTTATIDWTDYAREYDVLADHNAPYQRMLEHCLDCVTAWDFGDNAMIADFGGGTGNFSLAVARRRPDVRVLHFENNPEMLVRARGRAKELRLANWTAIRLDLDCPDWDFRGLAGAISVNVLYSLRWPQKSIRRMAQALRPGGLMYATSFGRKMNVWSWAMSLIWDNVVRHGARATWKLLCSTRRAREANRQLRFAQSRGRYWEHDLRAFRVPFEAAGIEVLEASDRVYRGCNDLIVGRKV